MIRKNGLTFAMGTFFGLLLAIAVLGMSNFSAAFSGPGSAAGSGTGALASDASTNISVGTTTLPGTARLYLVGTTTNSSYYSLYAADANGNPLLVVRNDGSIGIATTTFSGAAKLRVAGAIQTTTGGLIFPDGSTQISAYSATSTAAGYITPGYFNSVANTGGNYEFPANIAFGTSTVGGAVGQMYIYGAGFASTTWTTGEATSGATLYLRDSGAAAANGGQILFGSGQGIFAGIKGALESGSGPAGALIFQTRNTVGNVIERMRVDFNGNVGIGVTSPSTTLTVAGGNISAAGNKVVDLATPTLSSDAATKAYVDALNVNIRFAGYTTTTYVGNIGGGTGGIKNGNSICNSNFAGSHWAGGYDLIYLGASYPWSNTVWLAQTADIATNDCQHWLSSSTGSNGEWANTSSIQDPSTSGGACNNTYKLACVF